MRKLICSFVMVAMLAACADTFSQDLPQPILELSGTVLSRSRTEFKVYEKVSVGLSRTHTFKITENTIFFGIVIPSVFVTVRYTQRMLRPGLFVRTAVEVRGYQK
jgi:hypothetical protein